MKNKIKIAYLKELRKAKGLSTYEVASALNVPQSTYSGIENGSRGCSVENAKKIAALFGVAWSDFYE